MPDLPDCRAPGETLKEVRANLREDDEGWLGAANDEAVVHAAAAAR